MLSLQELNGQKAALDLVLSHFDTPKKHIVLLTGPSGSGISWTLGRAAEIWEERGGRTLQARGEDFATERSLFPWLSMVSPGAKRLARYEVLKAGVSHSSKAIPIVGQGRPLLRVAPLRGISPAFCRLL